MTAERNAQWNVGQIITDEDLQNSADVADDVATRVWETLAAARSTVGAASKLLIPLDGEPNGIAWEQGKHDPATMAYGIPGPAGYVRVKRFRAVIGAAAPDANTTPIAITARTPSWANVGPFAANSSGLDRVDLIVARVQIDASKVASRLVLDPVTKQKSSQNIVLEQAATIVPEIIVGTPGVGAPPVPADNLLTGVYYVPIARVPIPNGYTVGTALPTQLEQRWPRGGVHKRVIAPIAPLDGSGALTNPVPEAGWSMRAFERFGILNHSAAGALELSAPANAGGIDWRRRMARMQLVRPNDHGAIPGSDKSPTPPAVVIPGAGITLDSGWRHTGANGSNVLWLIPAATLGLSADLQIYVEHTTGKLFANFLGAPSTAPDPQRYFFHIEASDRFVI